VSEIFFIFFSSFYIVFSFLPQKNRNQIGCVLVAFWLRFGCGLVAFWLRFGCEKEIIEEALFDGMDYPQELRGEHPPQTESDRKTRRQIA
jgi:hypothetical protein